MQNLIKWPGGKISELKHIKKLIPKSFGTYYEPFVGGGALFFSLEPSRAVINDVSEELVMFYRCVKERKRRGRFKKELYRYVECWERIDTYIQFFRNSFIDLYTRYRNNQTDDCELERETKHLLDGSIILFNKLFSVSFCVDKRSLLKQIVWSILSRLSRMKHVIDINKTFTDDGIKQNIETAFRSAFYTHFRDVMNREKKGLITISDEKKVANYYFIREFCYSGGFRFNRDGEFNFPYGGMSYNRKNFRSKVDYLFSNTVRKLLKHTVIECIDFEELLKKHKPTPNDFLFFDPPYDCRFSKYEEHPFTKEDQKRLANCLSNLQAKFILIIKETPFIKKLYCNRGFKIISFNKTYTYNIRSRFGRKVKHLIIHNM